MGAGALGKEKEKRRSIGGFVATDPRWRYRGPQSARSIGRAARRQCGRTAGNCASEAQRGGQHRRGAALDGSERGVKLAAQDPCQVKCPSVLRIPTIRLRKASPDIS